MTSFRLSSEPVIFFYTIISTINYNVVPQLLLKKLCLRKNMSNTTLCDSELTIPVSIHKQASQWWFYLLLSVQIPSIFSVIISGRVTDRIGRRKGLLFFPCVDILASIVFLLNSLLIKMHPAFFILGYLLQAMYGELQGVFYLVYAFVADITKQNRNYRTPGMVLVDACGSLGTISGGLAVGFLIKEFGFHSVFIFNIVINLSTLSYVYFYLAQYESICEREEEVALFDSTADHEVNFDSSTETVNKLDQPSDKIERKNMKMTSYFESFRTIFKDKRGTYTMIPALMMGSFFIYAGYLGEYQIHALYLTASPFSFSPSYIGYYVLVQATSRFLGSLAIAILSCNYLHLGDFTITFIGVFSQITSYILIGLSRTKLTVFLASVVSFGVNCCLASTRSIITKNVDSRRYGIIVALTCSMNIVGALVANIVSTKIFQLTLTTYSGVVYFYLASFSCIGLGIIIWMRVRGKIA